MAFNIAAMGLFSLGIGLAEKFWKLVIRESLYPLNFFGQPFVKVTLREMARKRRIEA